MATHFDEFLQDRQYLKNVSPRTLEWYRLAFKQWRSYSRDAAFSQATVRAFMVGLRERNVSPVTCNNRARALNAFLKWMHTEGYLSAPLRTPLMRQERCVVTTLTDQQLRALVTFKPRSMAQLRAFTLANVL